MIPRILLGVATAASTLLTTPLRAAELGIRQDAGLVQLTLPGEDGKEYSLEAIQSFLDGSRWEPVATVAPTNRPVLLYDPTCTTRPQNFYRLRLLQGAVPVEVPNFRLLDLDGVAHELFYQSDTRCLVLILAGKDPAALGAHLPKLRELAGAGRTLAEVRGDPVFGDFGGRGWEWSANFFALGGIVLCLLRVADWRTPVAVLGATVALSLPFWLADPGLHPSPLQHVFSGALVLAAFFIATDPVSGCTTPRGRWIFGIGVAVLGYLYYESQQTHVRIDVPGFKLEAK